MFHETRKVKPKKEFRVLSCLIYTKIEKLCLHLLSNLSILKSKISLDSNMWRNILT